MGSATLNGDHESHSHPQRWMAAGAILTLIESAGMFATVAVGLSVYDCSLNTSSDTVWEMVHLYYFSHESCTPYYVDNNVYYFAGVNKAALRTVILMSLYLILYCTWFVGSILLLVSATKGKQMNPKLGRNLQTVWTIPTVLIIILDLIATVLYCIDLMSTGDFHSVMGLLNIKPDGALEQLNADYLSEPPKIMALLVSKAGFLWVINVIIFITLLIQFKKMYLLRKQQEFVRAQLSTIPTYEYPRPPKLADKNLPHAPSPIQQAPAIPRLVNQDGIVVGAQPSGSGRPSAIQIAARQGFSYERPNSGAWSPTNPASLSRGPRMSAPQKYGYSGFPQDNNDNWHSKHQSLPPRENEGSSNILQRDNDVFY